MSTLNINGTIVNRNSENVAIWSHISSSLLQSWIVEKNSHEKLLIIDSRCISDYNTLHINNAINIPFSKIILRKLLNDKISIIELLMKNSASTFLVEEVNIVVYDRQTEHTNQLAEVIEDNTSEDGFALILLSKIAQKFKSVSFLTGGFVSFKENNADLCASSNLSTSILFSKVLQRNSSMTLGNSDKNASCIKQSLEKHDTITEPTHQPTTNINNKKYVLKHSISSYDATSDFLKFSNTDRLMNTHNPTLASIPTSEKSPSLSLSVSSLKNRSNPETPTIREPTQILSYLYLGSQEDALSGATLSALGITNVLNASMNCPKSEFISDENFLRISVNDGHTAKIRPFFDVAFRFIEKCRKSNTKVLIHCLAGISRSPTLAIAYLMRHMNLRSDDAYKFVKERRQTISPNFNFLGQLYEYDRSLESQRSLSPQKNSTEPSKSTTITAPAFFKLKKIQKSQSSSTSSPLNMLNQAISPMTTLPEFNTNNNNDTTFSPKPVHQRKKQFIFPFGSNNPDENMCLTHSPGLRPNNMPSPMIELNSLAMHSPQTLPSPSQAFSKFTLNSPTVNSKPFLAASNSPSSQITTDSNKEQATSRPHLLKSLTVSSLNDKSKFNKERPSELIMQRPTNLLMSSNTSTNPNIPKSPSMILTTNEKSPLSPTTSDNRMPPAEPLKGGLKRPNSFFDIPLKRVDPGSPAESTKTTNHPFIVSAVKFNKYSSGVSSPLTTNQNTVITNTNLENNSACSCSSSTPNSRSSSGMSMTSGSPSTSSICHSCASSLAASQQFQKKFKLTPVQDS